MGQTIKDKQSLNTCFIWLWYLDETKYSPSPSQLPVSNLVPLSISVESLEERCGQLKPTMLNALSKFKFPNPLPPFGFVPGTNFKSDAQAMAMAMNWPSNQTALREIVLPTSAGKTAAVIIPFLNQPRNKLLFIIQASQTLITNQIQDIQELTNYSRGGQLEILRWTPSTAVDILTKLQNCSVRQGATIVELSKQFILFSTPESCNLKGYRSCKEQTTLLCEELQSLAHSNLFAGVVVDEAHDYLPLETSRQSFSSLPHLLNRLIGNSFDQVRVPLTLMTATLPSRYTSLLWSTLLGRHFFPQGEEKVIVELIIDRLRSSCCRPEVRVQLRNLDRSEQPVSASLLLDLTLNYLQEQRQLISEDDEWVLCSSIVVYVPNAEIVVEMARRFGELYPRCPCFCDHAQSREEAISQFRSVPIGILFCTTR